MLNASFFQQTRFVLSAGAVGQLPEDVGVEVAFAGRSNAGKSSALNRLTQQRGLARTSKTPGRTQLINVFSMQPGARLIDLPGYGFAAVPLEVKQRWHVLIDAYFKTRQSLKGLILVMDARHPLQPLDWTMLHWTEIHPRPVHIILTKADKLRFAQQKNTLKAVENEARVLSNPVTVQLFSAVSGLGVADLQGFLRSWFGSHSG
jgi:GTP-binding protein